MRGFLYNSFGFVGFTFVIIMMLFLIGAGIFALFWYVSKISSYFWHRDEYIKYHKNLLRIRDETLEQKEYRLELEKRRIRNELLEIKHKKELREKYSDLEN